MEDETTPVEETTNTEIPLTSKQVQEEELLQSAAEGVDEADDQPSRGVKPTVPPKKSKKKPLLFLLILVLVALLGGGVWYFLQNHKSASSANATSKQNQTSTTTTPALTHTLSTVVYAFRASEKEPYSLYYRPALGGDRKEALKLSTSAVVSYYDTRGSNVVVASDDGIYSSTDQGKTYKKVIVLNTGQQVTSLKLSTDGSSMVYGLLEAGSGKNTVKSADLDGKNQADLFIADTAGVFIYAWNKAQQRIFYDQGCYFCDGNVPTGLLRDIKAKTVTKVLGPDKINLATNPVISDDFSTIIYVEGVPVDPSLIDGLGLNAAAPYTVVVFNVKDGKATKLPPIGTKNEKNTNGTVKYRNFSLGFVAGTATPYYAEGMELNLVKDAKPSLLYKADQPFLDVSYVSDTNVLASTGTDTSDFLLANYSLADKKTTKIFMGDNNTVIFGVTEK